MIISLEKRIIKIPATCKVIMQRESEEKHLIKIPKTLLTDENEKSEIFLLSKLNNNNTVETKLDFLETDIYNNNYYIWNLTEDFTSEEGTLKIQIKIKRNVIEENKNDENENNENNNEEIKQQNEEIETESSKDEDFVLDNPNMDPDYLIPYGNNNKGIWYSYVNCFFIKKSLIITN